MKKLTLLLSILFFMLIQQNFAQTAREIMDKSTEAVQFSAMEMMLSLKIYDAKGNERNRTVSTASKDFNGVNKTLIKFISPADVKGTALLIYDYENQDDDMWIYMPAIRKTRRIVSSEKGKSFMGSEFTNADMSSPNLNDFSYKILGTVDYKAEACWKIESVCKDEDIQDENGFSKKVAYISKKNYLAYKVEFYDFEDELFKIQTIEQYKLQSNGKYFAFSMTVENLSNGRKSVMKIDKFQLGSSLTENTFSPLTLEK